MYNSINRGVNMDNRIRIPKQERSILKKEKIINAAYELFSQGN
jgi:hypothetical protein